jgi:UDP-N-acetylglucosamine 2-epimerase
VHRAENSDNRDRLQSILDAFREISQEKPVIFPVHPRIQRNLKTFKMDSTLGEQVRMIEPLSYFEMLVLEKNAWKILTDSGGMQKEAYFFEVPCVTLREETEWVETLEGGANILAGAEKERILGAALSSSAIKPSLRSPYGDGHASQRILRMISQLDSKVKKSC